MNEYVKITVYIIKQLLNSPGVFFICMVFLARKFLARLGTAILLGMMGDEAGKLFLENRKKD